MKTYVVGGAVRDRLLGLPVRDRDHVVVGATADEMLAAGFKPVGRDFPVFLHPVTHEEYALARTERKVAPGYAGFVFHADPTVTLEEDLVRRDFTINAMAEDETTGELVDPFGGRRDLAARTFRHVGPAFAEDPVRILRLARFAARFTDFDVAESTRTLMHRMVDAGEVDALVPERVWQEIARGLMEARPSRMIAVLRESGALARVLPELESSSGDGAAMLAALDRAAAGDAPLGVRFAILVHAVGTMPADADRMIDAVCSRLAVPAAVRDVARLVGRHRGDLLALGRPAPIETIAREATEQVEACDGLRRAARFADVVAAVGFTADDDAGWRTTIDAASTAARSVDAAAVAAVHAGEPARIRDALHAERVAAVVDALSHVGR